MVRSTLLTMGITAGLAGCAGLRTVPDRDIRALADGIARQRLAAAQVERDRVEREGMDHARRYERDVVAGETSAFGRSQRIMASSEARSVAELYPFALVAFDESATTMPSEAGTSPDEGPDESAGVERGPLPGFMETVKRDLREMPGLLWDDTKSVYTDPYNLVFILGFGGASAALRPEVDDDIEDYYDDHHSMKEDWRDAFGAAGNPITHFALAGAWYLVGQQAQDAKTYEVGKRAISALTITGVTTMLLKVSACTDSPNGESLAWPSGHVSSTMAFATVLNDAYGPLVGIPMFGLTGLVALERMDSGEHHFSDVVFGAALGWVVAHTVMKEHRPEIFGGEIVPYVDPNGRNAGLAWVKTLGHE